MEFDVKQINELLTGIVLACELKSDKSELRRFITVKSFNVDSNDRLMPWDKKIKSADEGNYALFVVHSYSVSAKYIELDYDIDDDCLEDNIVIDDIVGLDKLYEVLSEHLDDLSVLIPQWHIDNPVE